MRICLLSIGSKWSRRSIKPNGLASTPTTVAGQAHRQCVTKSVPLKRLNSLSTKRLELSDLWKYLTLSEILNLTFLYSFQQAMIDKVELSRISIKRTPRVWSKAFKTSQLMSTQHRTRHSINKWTSSLSKRISCCITLLQRSLHNAAITSIIVKCFTSCSKVTLNW